MLVSARCSRHAFLAGFVEKSSFSQCFVGKSRWWAIMKRQACTTASGVGVTEQPAKLRHIRYRDKVDGKLPVPSLIELVVVGTGGGGSPKSLLVNMSNFKYLFNCGEGTQRITAEHKMKLSRVDQIFITHASWDNLGGLMGLCLTVETAGVESITLHGPPDAESHVASATTFAQLRSLKLHKREIAAGDFVDSAMCIRYVPIYADGVSAIRPPLPETELFPGLADSETDESDDSGDFAAAAGVKKRRLSPPISAVDLPESTKAQRAIPAERSMAVAYICTPHVKPRSVSLEKCVECNVPAGPLMGLLKDGNDVTLPCGTTVRPDDVLEAAEPNNPFIVVECPSEAYVDSLVSSAELARYQALSEEFSRAGQSPDCGACVVVHFSPPSVCNTAKYQAWMERFGEETEHIIVNESCPDLSLEAVYRIQAKLHLLHPSIYPLLPRQRDQDAALTGQESFVSSPQRRVTYGETNLAYILRARVGRVFCRERCLKIDNASYTAEALAQTDFSAALDQLQQDLATTSAVPAGGENGIYPEILFLGTGSTMPNKARNVSAIWLNLNASDSLLLDCGENTYGQLCRHYGEETPAMLSRLRAVYVSHLHADHHLGLVGLALERWRHLQSASLPSVPLVVLAPGQLRSWYTVLHSDLVPILQLVSVVPLERLYEHYRDKYSQTYDQVLSLLKLNLFLPVRALHRQWPHAVVLEHRDGWRLSYSGDTMPCRNFIEAGVGSDILIHEATMEDDLVEEAKERKHSTTSQAIDVGVQMKAKAILLTHFSQRYAKVPLLNDNFASHVGIAFDNMRVRHCDLPLLSKFTPALKALFAEDYVDMEKKTEKKKRLKNTKKNAVEEVSRKQILVS